MKEFKAKGWRIDVDKVARNKDKVAYAIPSPGRRRSYKSCDTESRFD
jgi:hypothetical protein